MAGDLVLERGDLRVFLREILAVLLLGFGFLRRHFAFCLRLGLGEPFMHFGLEFLGADLVENVGVARFVDGEGGVAVRAFDFVHGSLAGGMGKGRF